MVHQFNTAKTFNRRRNGHGGRQHTVSQKSRAAEHGGDDQPFAVVTNQRIQREDAALAVVVCFHGDKNVFDGRQQRDGPDDEGERADDELFVDFIDAAVALYDGFHNIQRRRADIAINDADGHKEHAELKTRRIAFFHARNAPAFL